MTASPWRFDAIGVPWQVETARPLPDEDRDRVRALIADFDRTWSRFREDSVVAALAAGAGGVRAPDDAAAMLDLYAQLSEATDGAVNPLVGDALASRGYDGSISLIDRGAQPAPPASGVRITGDVLEVAPPALIDVGALGKGRLVDLVLAELPASLGPAVVDASGDIAVRGAAQRIGLEHPFDARRAIGAWSVTDAALCASAANRRAWGHGLHHVLDARTGEPVRTVAATWAVAPDAMHADAAATALFFDGGPRLAAEWSVAWVRMLTDGRVEWSPGCDADLFVAR